MDIKATIKEALHEAGLLGGGGANEREQLTAQVKTLTESLQSVTGERDALKAEVTRYKDAETAQSQATLAAARDRATKAIIAAKGQDSAEVPLLKVSVEAMNDVATLGALADTFEAAAKATTGAGAGRQTVPALDNAAAALSGVTSDEDKARLDAEVSASFDASFGAKKGKN